MKNGFYNVNNDCFLLSCELIFGKVEEGDKLILDGESKFLIRNVETPMKDIPSSKIVSIRKEELGTINIALLYANEYFIED